MMAQQQQQQQQQERPVITEEDESNIVQLCGITGFDRNKCYKGYVVCGKNLELAASYMLENPNFDTEDIDEQGNEMGDGPQGGQDQGEDPNQGGQAGGDGANQN